MAPYGIIFAILMLCGFMVFSIAQHSSDISLFNQYNNLDVCMNSLR